MGVIKRDGRIQHFQGPYFPEAEEIEKQHDELLKDSRRKEITTFIKEEIE